MGKGSGEGTRGLLITSLGKTETLERAWQLCSFQCGSANSRVKHKGMNVVCVVQMKENVTSEKGGIPSAWITHVMHFPQWLTKYFSLMKPTELQLMSLPPPSPNYPPPTSSPSGNRISWRWALHLSTLSLWYLVPHHPVLTTTSTSSDSIINNKTYEFLQNTVKFIFLLVFTILYTWIQVLLIFILFFLNLF